MFLIAVGYAGLLTGVAFLSERARLRGARRRIVYTLGLAVYCTSWTFHGAVGSAVATGWAYLPIYLGPILVFLLMPGFLARLVKAAQEEGATSIADFIGARFGKSRGVAALVTILALFGTVPYLALQLRSVGTTYADLTGSANSGGPIVVTAIVLAGFAMLFGNRRLERAGGNDGVLVAVSIESVVKFAAFVAIGLFSLLLIAQAAPADRSIAVAALAGRFAPDALDANFVVITLLAAAAIVCLPRQFFVAVVAATSPGDPVAARWPLITYLAVIALLVVPIALAGCLGTASVADPDLLVIDMPLARGESWLALLVFLGGFSAATGMVLVETIALATMVSNDLVGPILLRSPSLAKARDIGGALLWVRRAVMLLLMAVALAYALVIPPGQRLAAIGLVAFAAMAQFAPALILAVRARGHDPVSAKAGLTAGLMMWAITLFVPTIIGRPILPHPGFAGLDLVSEGAVASLLVNLLVHGAVLARRIRAPRLVFHRDDRIATIRDRAELIRLAGRFVGMERATAVLGEGERIDQQTARRAERLIAEVVGAPSARVLVASALSGAAMSVDDVTRMLDESGQSLQFSKGLLAATLENIDSGVSVVDADLNLIAWNGRYLELFDFPPGLIRVGAPIADAIAFNALAGECGPGEVRDHVERRLAHMRRGTPHSFVRVRPDGRVLKTVGGPMPGGGYVMSFTDTTAEARALAAAEAARDALESRVRERTAALSQANAALAAATRDKTRFLAAASHDLLQPLHAARLFAAALAREREDPLVERIDRSIVAAEQLLRALLDISKLDAGGIVPKPAVFGLRALLDDLVAGFAGQAAAKGLRLRVMGGDVTVRTDRVLLRQIVQNLIGNAVRYTMAGGIVVAVRRRGGDVRIEVMDTGPGIPEDRRGVIFREFERLDTGEDAGVGLGLAIVERTVRLLGLSQDLDSVVGRGSRFTLMLPVAEGGVTDVAPKPSDTIGHARVRPVRSMTLLVVDDDPAVRAGMEALLGRSGHRVLTVSDRTGALGLVDEIDAALVDYDLGDDDGLALIAELRRDRPSLPVILITADGSPSLAEQAKASGIAVLLKPVDPDLLAEWLSGLGPIDIDADTPSPLDRGEG
ncbi:PAS domain-containing hybrid sensor histidine kinase/response regulator [Sphingomonas pseudosanguinis]|nr:PAS domain-containing hybrid sensor histidine kinase/response regulator [Sphingomonas pseudosanguinis]